MPQDEQDKAVATISAILRGESSTNSPALAAYLLHSGLGPDTIAEQLKGMLEAQVFVLSKFGKVMDAAPDWKVRGKALEILIDIYGGKFQPKHVEQLVPPQLVVFYNNLSRTPIGELVQEAEDLGLELPEQAAKIKRPPRKRKARSAVVRDQAASD